MAVEKVGEKYRCNVCGNKVRPRNARQVTDGEPEIS